MQSEIIRDAAGLAALSAAWAALWRTAPGRPVNLHPAWVESWWSAFWGDGERMVLVCREGADLVGVAPLFVTPPRGGALHLRELRLIGDGIIGASSAILARIGRESEVVEAVAAALFEEPGWDALDLALAQPAALDGLARRFAALGRKTEMVETLGRPQAPLDEKGRAWLLGRRAPPLPEGAAVVEGLPVERALAQLTGRLHARSSRATAEPAFLSFLELLVPRLVADRAARLICLEIAGKIEAATLVLIDGRRWIELAAVAGPAIPTEAITRVAIEQAIAAGAEVFEFSDEEHPLANARAEGARLRVHDGGGRIQRGYASFVRRAGAVADAAARGREQIAELGDRLSRSYAAAPEVARRVVARVATFSRMHLYRGELFVRGAPPPAEATLRLVTLEEFEARADRAAIVDRLGLAEEYCRQKWRRGDMVVLAELDGQGGAPSRAAGIVWCARSTVFVPDLGRDVRPLAGECYIHDVYVTPEARGHNIAPAMLEFLARALRQRDIYRAWALIERSNTASTRAFEKAGYAAVADVVFARMGLASKLIVRPPDPEARAFLGYGKALRPR